MSAAGVMLADLGLERSANAERGLVVLAIIACVLGLVTTLRWRWRPPSFEHTASEDERGWPFIRKTIKNVAQMMAGVLAIFLLSKATTPRPQQPPGWLLISPPHEASVLAMQNEVLWAGGREGLFAIDRKTAKLLDTPLRSHDLRGVTALLCEGDVLWIGCKQGLLRWKGDKLEKNLPPGSRDIGPVFALRRLRDGSLWAGVTRGAWQLSGDAWKWHGEDEGLVIPAVDTLHEDRQGALWLACREPESPGLWRLESGRWRLLTQADGLAHPAVNGILEDHQGAMWIACGFGTSGSAQAFSNGKLGAGLALPGLKDAKVRSLFEDSQHRMWFCSEFSGVAVREEDRWRRMTMNDGLPGNEIKMMLEDVDGVLWLASERGLGRIPPFE